MTVVTLDSRRRSATIGGSRAAAACGLDPRVSRIELWHELLHGIERPQSEAMAIGLEAQPLIEQLVTQRGFEIVPAPADGFVREGRPWMIVHPDAFVTVEGERGLGEWKTRGLGWADDAQALAAAVMQLQHGFEVTGTTVGLLAVLHGGYGGMRLDLRTVWRDDDLIRMMVEHEEELLDFVQRGVPPPPDGSDSARQTVRELFPVSNGETIRLSKQGWENVKQIRALKEQLKAAKKRQAELEQAVQLEMGEAASAISPFDTPACKWTTFPRTAIDTTRLKKERPDIAKAFSETSTLRRFSVD